MKNLKNKAMLAGSMFIFGTIGIFRNYIPFPSGSIACARGFIGFLFLLIFMAITKKKIGFADIRNNLALLLLSGAFIGFNWILLFEAYRFTTVPKATLCYYMQPVFVILLSPLFFKEKLTLKKVLCTAAAFAGMILVSGIIGNKEQSVDEIKGILFGLGAAVLYAGVVIMNKKLKKISAYDKTVVQLAAAAVVILPYTLIFENTDGVALNAVTVIMVFVVGIVHTGIAYVLYFGSMDGLKAQTIAIFGYIDPVVAIILSAVILPDDPGLIGIIGAVLILGSTFISEFDFSSISKKEKKDI